MNQILSVETKNNKGKRPKKTSIHSIVVVFAIMLIIFGIGIAGTGAFSYYRAISANDAQGNLPVVNTKPIITTERVNANTIKIVATHDKGIQNVKYKINDEEEIEVNAEKKLEFSKEITLPSGTVSLAITVEDVNGITAYKESTYEVESGPTIVLEQIETAIKATITSAENIDYIRFYWDDDEENAKKYTCNDIKYETIIEVLEGTHTLHIEAFDINGKNTRKSQKVIGDTKPEINVTTDGENFIINAKDDEELTKIEIKLNSNDTISEEITGKEYTKNIKLEDGLNKITIKVYNKNGIYETKKIKYTKE